MSDPLDLCSTEEHDDHLRIEEVHERVIYCTPRFIRRSSIGGCKPAGCVQGSPVPDENTSVLPLAGSVSGVWKYGKGTEGRVVLE